MSSSKHKLIEIYTDFLDYYQDNELEVNLEMVTLEYDYIYRVTFKDVSDLFFEFAIHRYCNNHTEDFGGRPCDNLYEKGTYYLYNHNLSKIDFIDKNLLLEALKSKEVFEHFYTVIYDDLLEDANNDSWVKCEHCEDNPYIDYDQYADCLPDYMYG